MRSANHSISRLFSTCGFVVLAYHFAIRIHLEANLSAVLVNDCSIIGAFPFPTDNCSALGLRLGSRLHCSRNIRTFDGLSLGVFRSLV